ncbi:MAG TPA: tetratricopeptide repeat protein, partial [Ktedonobacteraceae bacterium]|nr:tetratricopeptide repeat protein [Ktedonobacteraceae bacterium]
SYLGDIHQMRVDYDLAKSKTDPNDSALQQAYQAYLAGSAILHDKINLPTINANQIPLDTEANLPLCQSSDGKINYSPEQWTQGSLSVALGCLSSINHHALEQANTDANSFLGSTFWLLLFLGVLLSGLLIFSTIRMMATSHRAINPGLLPAALIALILGVSLLGLVNSLGKQGDHTGWQADPVSHIDQAASIDGAFQQMVSDNYDSVYDAAILTRYATDANADESRWLIAQEFNDTANIQRWQTDWQYNVGQVHYWMQNAQNNLTWTEEQSPLQQMTTNWNQYVNIDGQIRSDVTNQSDPNRLLTAEALSTGNSNSAFGHFTDAVSQLSAADQGHYNTTRDATSQSLGLSFLLSLVLFPLTGLLAVWGVWLRLKDF